MVEKIVENTEKIKVLWEQSLGLEGLEGLAQRIVTDLQKQDKFCLWLQGTLGMGKTTLTGELFYALGLSRLVPVTSPTFAYLYEYALADKLYAHMDLYRLSEGWDPEELGLYPDHSYTGLIIEWPERITNQTFLQASHRLVIAPGDSFEQRHYRFEQVV